MKLTITQTKETGYNPTRVSFDLELTPEEKKLNFKTKIAPCDLHFLRNHSTWAEWKGTEGDLFTHTEWRIPEPMTADDLEELFLFLRGMLKDRRKRAEWSRSVAMELVESF